PVVAGGAAALLPPLHGIVLQERQPALDRLAALLRGCLVRGLFLGVVAASWPQAESQDTARSHHYPGVKVGVHLPLSFALEASRSGDQGRTKPRVPRPGAMELQSTAGIYVHQCKRRGEGTATRFCHQSGLSGGGCSSRGEKGIAAAYPSIPDEK